MFCIVFRVDYIYTKKDYVVWKMSIEVLHVDDESSLLVLAKIFLERINEEIEVHTALSAEIALDLMAEKEFDVIVSDYRCLKRMGWNS